MGPILLLAALALVIGSVGYGIWRQQDGAARAEAPVADGGAAPDMAALERQAQADPGNAGAWQKLAFAYFEQGRYADAARAYEKASGLAPDRAVLWSSLGEARVMASEADPMPAPAAQAFRKALEIDPADPRARYFLAVERDLKGDHAGAIGDWLALLADTPQDAPWRADLIRTIEQVGKINKIDVADRLARAGAASPAPVADAAPMAAKAIPGPTASDMQAATAMTPGEQKDMAEAMVARLEAKLAADPANVEGWIMLMRSRMAQQRPTDAAAALKKAVAANPASAGKLRDEARFLGVPGV